MPLITPIKASWLLAAGISNEPLQERESKPPELGKMHWALEMLPKHLPSLVACFANLEV